MNGRFSWRRTQRPTGLAAVAAAGKPRGYELRRGGKLYATVSHTDQYGGGWYWVAGWDSGVPLKNTASAPPRGERRHVRTA